MKRADSPIVGDISQYKRPMRRRLGWRLRWTAALIIALLSSPGRAAQPVRKDSTPLIKLASSTFPNLTFAERAMLKFAEIDNVDRGAIAVCGSSPNPADPTNDPKNATGWSAQRNIRASLIEWLCLNPHANALVYPKGIRIMGARIVGGLDLSQVRVPIAIVMHNCSVSERMTLAATDLPYLELDGSYVGEIDAPGINVHGDLSLSGGFHAAGEVNLHGATIGGDLLCVGGHFTHSGVDLFNPDNKERRAIDGNQARVKGLAALCCGTEKDAFRADGEVALGGTMIGGDLFLDGQFLNPSKTAIDVNSADITGNALIGFARSFEADGLVSFLGTRVGTNFVVSQATFSGRSSDHHGLDASEISVKNAFVWHNVLLPHGATLILAGASTQALLDDESSWPTPGNLNIEGFTYGGLGPPDDARSRLRWLNLQSGYHPQPYRQLAKALREIGDEDGATEVLIASEDARFRSSGWLGHFWSGFLRTTVGYGHKPLRTVLWSLMAIALGWLLVTIGARAGVMRATWPDSPPPLEPVAYEKLHPLLFSLDVFLPFVNLHQEHYWWPDAERSGELTVLGRRLRISGTFLRYYLWTQVIAGWLLSAIFVAGVTGLMRND
jgi:hypothetical protein